ncbi:AvrE-family type 3 secretion system effector, partial [Pseudomonas syringae pv. tagetis]|uniref:AvrE-family type 3 secretion system effector n=1 Tax=Pseudomonas syringae group genomosp. 7 TaxID=251699 RepID=UPI0037706A4A
PVDLKPTAVASQSEGEVFKVQDEDIDGFVDQLFEGKMNPLQELKKPVYHETNQARRFTLDITTGATAYLRAGLNLTEDST